MSGKPQKVRENLGSVGIMPEKMILEEGEKEIDCENCRDFNKNYVESGLKTGISEWLNTLFKKSLLRSKIWANFAFFQEIFD